MRGLFLVAKALLELLKESRGSLKKSRPSKPSKLTIHDGGTGVGKGPHKGKFQEGCSLVEHEHRHVWL